MRDHYILVPYIIANEFNQRKLHFAWIEPIGLHQKRKIKKILLKWQFHLLCGFSSMNYKLKDKCNHLKYFWWKWNLNSILRLIFLLSFFIRFSPPPPMNHKLEIYWLKRWLISFQGLLIDCARHLEIFVVEGDWVQKKKLTICNIHCDQI